MQLRIDFIHWESSDGLKKAAAMPSVAKKECKIFSSRGSVPRGENDQTDARTEID